MPAHISMFDAEQSQTGQ